MYRNFQTAQFYIKTKAVFFSIIYLLDIKKDMAQKVNYDKK